MQTYKGLYFPDGEKRIIETIEGEKGPTFDGLPTYQFRKLAKALQYVRNYRAAVDIGAHVGLWSRPLARMFQRVTAFEPTSAFRECFPRNIHPNDFAKVQLYPFALGKENGEIEIVVKETNTGLTHVMTEGEAVLDGRRREVVKMVPLSAFEFDAMDFVKIDVEGYEKNVLLGGEDLIRYFKPCIVIEQKPGLSDRYGFGQFEAIELLQKWGATERFNWGGDYCMSWVKDQK